MFNIASYLDKFKNFGQGEKIFKETIVGVVKEITSVNIDIKNITIKNGEVIFNVSPAIKNILFIKKNLILEKLASKRLKDNVLDIR